jgi:hypothetical protein
MSDNNHHRRKTDEPLKHVEVDAVGDTAKKVKDQFLVLLFGILLATVTGIPATIWAGSKWVTRVELAINQVGHDLNDAVEEMRIHVTTDDLRTQQIREAVESIDKTMTRVVVNQENLSDRVSRMEAHEDRQRE